MIGTVLALVLAGNLQAELPETMHLSPRGSQDFRISADQLKMMNTAISLHLKSAKPGWTDESQYAIRALTSKGTFEVRISVLRTKNQKDWGAAGGLHAKNYVFSLATGKLLRVVQPR